MNKSIISLMIDFQITENQGVRMYININKANFSLLLSFFLIIFLPLSSFAHVQPPQKHSFYDEPKYSFLRYNMYSSNEKKFVWFRVFKVASGTIKDLLLEDTMDLTQSHPRIFPKKFKDYFKFSFVRNPWDRVVSCYFHKVVTKKATDFKECFDKDFDFFVDYIKNLDLNTANPHIRLQTRLIPVKECDFIGKCDEHFLENLQYVCNMIGVEYHEIPHKHKTDHAHYSTYYTPRTQKIIAEKYKEDIEAFGFTFEVK